MVLLTLFSYPQLYDHFFNPGANPKPGASPAICRLLAHYIIAYFCNSLVPGVWKKKRKNK